MAAPNSPAQAGKRAPASPGVRIGIVRGGVPLALLAPLRIARTPAGNNWFLMETRLAPSSRATGRVRARNGSSGTQLDGPEPRRRAPAATPGPGAAPAGNQDALRQIP